MSKLVSEYRALMQELRDRFGHFIIIGARPNTSDQISGMRWVSRQLSIAFATDDHITVVDIFEHPDMLMAARGSKNRVNMATRAHPARGGIIHYNQQEAQCFLRIVDKTIQSVDARYVKAKPARGGRMKKKVIHSHPSTITWKLSKKNICQYTLSLYRKYGDKQLFIPLAERNYH